MMHALASLSGVGSALPPAMSCLLPVQRLNIETRGAAVALGYRLELLAGEDGGDVVLGPPNALLGHLQHALRAELAVAEGDRRRRRKTLRLVALQR